MDAGKGGVPSDHWGLLVKPRTNLSTTKARRTKTTILVRRMPDSLVDDFGPRLAEKDWRFLEDGLPVNQMVDEFQIAASWRGDEIFKMKTVTIIEGDKPFFTDELRQMR